MLYALQERSDVIYLILLTFNILSIEKKVAVNVKCAMKVHVSLYFLFIV